MVSFSVHCKEKVCRFNAARDEYHSLMHLICDHFPVRGFGICYGGGCCGTCGVFVITNNGSPKFELSCEMRIDQTLNNKTIIVPE